MSGGQNGAAPILHRRIRAELEDEIRSGAWAAGYRLPTEQELMARYGCARMTVSKAMASLVQAGLVERRKKAGSFVARPHVQTAALEIPDIPSLIGTRGGVYRFERLRRRFGSAGDFRIEVPPASAADRVLAVTGLHLADGAPFALERRIVNLAAAPQAASLPFDVEPPGTWLLRTVAWTQARHRITAINADAWTARRLALRRGRACLVVERWTWRGPQWITFVRQTFPADRYDLVASFGP
jgi:GntR family histidine utilization transcriptional repressor